MTCLKLAQVPLQNLHRKTCRLPQALQNVPAHLEDVLKGCSDPFRLLGMPAVVILQGRANEGE